MSLKVFHLGFITLSTLVLLGFGLWSFSESPGGFRILGLVSFVMAIVLAIYGLRFKKKIVNAQKF